MVCALRTGSTAELCPRRFPLRLLVCLRKQQSPFSPASPKRRQGQQSLSCDPEICPDVLVEPHGKAKLLQGPVNFKGNPSPRPVLPTSGGAWGLQQIVSRLCLADPEASLSAAAVVKVDLKSFDIYCLVFSNKFCYLGAT